MSDYVEDIHKELYEVSEADDCARVRVLLGAGADPDKYKDEEDGVTALVGAALKGHNEVVKTLIQAKCDLNVQNKNGETALYWAAANGHRDVVISLLESGADPYIMNNEGETPIEVAKYDEIAG